MPEERYREVCVSASEASNGDATTVPIESDFKSGDAATPPDKHDLDKDVATTAPMYQLEKMGTVYNTGQ